MSKNITIQEGGSGKSFNNTTKLKTTTIGGGSCYWVPEDETTLGTKYINANGTYVAANDGYYGYSQVTVSGVGTVTGTDPQTGSTVNYSRDPDTGNIVERVLPKLIIVTTPPTKTEYNDGDLIDFTGMVVKAYENESTVWTDTNYPNGVIPFNELTLPDKVALLEKVENEGVALVDPVYGGVTYEGAVVNGIVLPGGEYTPYGVHQGGGGCWIYPDAEDMVFCGYEYLVISACAEQKSFWLADSTGSSHAGTATMVMHDGKIAYVATLNKNVKSRAVEFNEDFPISSGEDLSASIIGWMMLYGSETGIDPQTGEMTYNTGRTGGQEVPVKWARPVDSQVLETSFTIKVSEAAPEPAEEEEETTP